MLVAARPIDRPPRGLGRTPGGCILVIPGALPNRRAVFEVAGCQGFLRPTRAAELPPPRFGGRWPGCTQSAGGRRGHRQRGAARDRVPIRDPTLPVPTARGLAFVALAAFGVAALDGAARAGRAEPRAVRARRRASWRCSACSPPPGCSTAARAAGGRGRRRSSWRSRWPCSAAASPTSCCGPTAGASWLRHQPRHRVAARRARPVPRRRRVDAHGDPARRHGARRRSPPRSRSGRAATAAPASPASALGLLVALYAIPAVALDFENEFLRGAALALLVLAFLRLEKLRVGDASNAGLVAAGVAVLALMLAPALDGDAAVVGLRELGARRRLGAVDRRSRGTTTTARSTGRATAASCCACARSGAPAYWKAENLDGFDGVRWVQTRSDFEDPAHARTTPRRSGPARSEIRVDDPQPRAADDFVTAGYADDVDSPTIRETARGDGTWIAGRDAAPRRRLRGDRLHAADQRGAAPGGRAGDRPRRRGARSAGCCCPAAAPRSARPARR